MTKPAIIVVAFNRPKSLERLLSSINKSIFPKGEVPLCICIDYQDSDANRDVVQMAEDFAWNFGPKEVIHQTENLGLKAHVLKCGDLSERFGSIIMLEDDLYVSPAFYTFSYEALAFYKNREKVGGISLYNHKVNISNLVPFEPITDNSNVFFLQIASSWGQAWNRNQWGAFREWLVLNPFIQEDVFMPEYIKKWPNSSWLKHFINYLVDQDKYFVYPRIGLSTNFGDSGENNKKASTFFQVPLLQEERKFAFNTIEKSLSVYDSFFEINSDVLKRMNPRLNDYDFSVNLYGLKPINKILEDFILVKGEFNDPEYSFPMSLKPIDLNVASGLKGKGIALVYIDQINSNSFSQKKRVFEYFWGVVPLKEKVLNILAVILSKFEK
jgi:hypothetical protein